MNKFLSLLLVAAFALSGCSFSSQGRRQRAYEKYVRKSSMTRVKQQSRFRSSKPQKMPSQLMEPSEPVESTETGPQAVPTDN